MLVVFSGCNVNKREPRTSFDLDNYLKYCDDLYSIPDYNDAPIVFPKKITDSMTINDYMFVEVVQAFQSVGKHFYLDVTYSAEEYFNELKRLKDWSREYSYGEEKGVGKLLYNEQDFYYPAYVASYNKLLAYEYALILQDNRIIYVYISRIKEGETRLKEEFLPRQYFEKNLSTKGFSYSIYYDEDLCKQHS